MTEHITDILERIRKRLIYSGNNLLTSISRRKLKRAAEDVREAKEIKEAVDK